MADVLGQRTTQNVEQEQRVIDMHREILLLEPDASPIVVFTKRLNRRAARDVKYSWMEDELDVRFAAGVGAQLAATTTLNVVDASIIPPESLIRVPRTGEVMFVISVNTGANTIDVERGVGATTAADLVDQEPLYLIGIADESGDTSLQARSDNPVPVTNFTQIFKRSVAASGSWLSSDNVTDTHDWPYQRRKAGIDHAKDIELSFLFGTPDEGLGSTPPRRKTAGVLHYVTQNQVDAAGALTPTVWEDWQRAFFRFGSQQRVVFVSPLVLSQVNEFSRSQLQTSVGDRVHGVRVMRTLSAHGELMLVKHNLLEGDVFGGYAIALDFGPNSAIQYRFLGGGPGGSRDTSLLTERQENDRDGRKDEYLTEAGLQLPEPKKHGLLTGVV